MAKTNWSSPTAPRDNPANDRHVGSPWKKTFVIARTKFTWRGERSTGMTWMTGSRPSESSLS
jgi:hypothetical protein